MANGWTPDRQARQSELIRQWQPWAKSTGPKTIESKATVSQNAFKGGWREQMRELARLLREQGSGLATQLVEIPYNSVTELADPEVVSPTQIL